MPERQIRADNLPGGSFLCLNALDSYAGLQGLTVYTVMFGDTDGMENHAYGSEHFLTEAEANTAYDARLASKDPSKLSSEDGGTYGVLLDTFARYLGEHSIRSVPVPTDWAGCQKHVAETAFNHNDVYGYDGEAVHVSLEALGKPNGLSGDDANKKIELPAWKVFELLTIITGLILRLQVKEQQLATRKAA